MTDIVERLRERNPWHPLYGEAADEIERLRELFRIDGEQHATHLRNITKQFEIRRKASADKIERLRAEVEHLTDICNKHWTGQDMLGTLRAFKEQKK